MTLQKQLVHLNLTGGLQKKDDDKLVIPTKLTVADNVEFDDASTVIRRGGQAALGSGGSAAAVRMYEHDGVVHLELADGTHIRRTSGGNYAILDTSGYSQVATRVGALVTAIQGFNTLTSPTTHTDSRRGMDVAVGNSTYMLVWEDQGAGSTGLGWALSIRSLTTNAEIFSQYNIATSNYRVRPRVLWDSTNSRYVFLCAEYAPADTSYTVTGFALTEAGATAVSGATLMTVTGAAVVGDTLLREAMFDASIYAGQGIFIAARGSDNDIYARLFTLGLVGSGTLQTDTVTTGYYALTTHITYASTVLTGHLFYDNAMTLRGRTLPSDTGLLSAENTITPTAGIFSTADVIFRTAVTDSGANLLIAADAYRTDATTGKQVMGQFVLTVGTNHVLSATKQLATKCPLAGRIFTMNSRFYLPVLFDSQEYQRVVLVADLSAAAAAVSAAPTPTFIARLAYGEIGGYTSDTGEDAFLMFNPHHRVATSYSNFIPIVKYAGNTRLAGTEDHTPAVIARVQLDHDEQLGQVEANGVTYLAGALPLMVDGGRVVEEGFHFAPEVAPAGQLTAVTTGTGFYDFPADGTYSVAFTYAWQDSKSNWHESPPSSTYTVTTTAGLHGLDGGVVTPPTLKPGAQLLMYRTLGSSTDTTLYLAHSVPLGAGVTMADANLVSGETLYTEGGVLPNSPMPTCRQLSIFQKRVVAAGCDDGHKIYWSKQLSPGFAAEFVTSDVSFQLTVPAALGRVAGAVELDDKLIIACESGIGAIYGQGPAPTGTQGQYSDFATLVTETGARWDSPKSIIRGPEGVWFRSPFGIRLLSRGGGLARGQDGKQVGAEVDPLVAVTDTVVAVAGNAKDGATGDSKQQIKFYLSSGSVLVWDYQWMQWTRFTGVANIDAVYAGANAYHVKNVSTTPLVRYFDASTYTDVNDSGTTAQAFTSTITTGWLSFAGIQGFQRIYRLMLLGNVDSLDPQTVAGSFVYDFTSTVGDSFTSNISPPADLNIQAQHHFAKQKCEAMKMTITFKPQTTTDEGRFRLTDLTLQVGVKGGYFKLPSASRV